MEKSCRSDCLACGMRGAFSLRPVFVEEQWVGNAVSDRESVPGSCFQASAGARDLTAAMRFVLNLRALASSPGWVRRDTSSSGSGERITEEPSVAP